MSGETSSRRSITAIVMRDALAVGEIPAKKSKKEKPERTVLEEEEYLGNLEKIIQRDYFPSIPKLRAQTEYLDAVERNDVAKIRELQLKFSSRRTEPRQNSPTLRRSPSTFETPDVHKKGPIERPATETQNPECPEGTSNALEVKKKPVNIDKLTVDKFLATYNSEDNAAFDDLQKLDDRRHKIKHGWMYKAEIKHNQEKISQGPDALAIRPADEQLALPYDRPKELDNWSYKAQNNVLFKPEAVELTEAELVEQAKLEPPQIRSVNTRFDANPFSEAVRRERMVKAGIIQKQEENAYILSKN